MNNIKKVLSVWMLATCVLPVAAQYPVIPDSVKAKIVAANGLDLRLFRTLPDYYRALPGKLSDTLVAMDRAGASRTELAQAMGGLRGMRLGMLEGNTDEGYISVGAGIGNIHAITSVAEVVNQLAV